MDLRKVYDSVPRKALWRGLQCIGVRREDIAVNNRLRQGCSISPVLFNLYFALVLERWCAALQQQCPAEQFHFLYTMSAACFHEHGLRAPKLHVQTLSFLMMLD